jgi:hypothetical protein
MKQTQIKRITRKAISVAFIFIIVASACNAQYFKGRKYRELIQRDTLSYSRLLSYDSTFNSHRITYKTPEMRFYKYNDSTASIVLMSEMYNIPLHVNSLMKMVLRFMNLFMYDIFRLTIPVSKVRLLL